MCTHQSITDQVLFLTKFSFINILSKSINAFIPIKNEEINERSKTNNLKQLAIELSSFNTYVHLKIIQKAIVSCLYYIISVKSNTFAAQIAVTGVVFFYLNIIDKWCYYY